MSGTIEGGRKAAVTTRKRYGKDFYKKLGAMGGKSGKAQGTIKGFAAASPEQLRKWGKKGGKKSKRGKK